MNRWLLSLLVVLAVIASALDVIMIVGGLMLMSQILKHLGWSA